MTPTPSDTETLSPIHRVIARRKAVAAFTTILDRRLEERRQHYQAVGAEQSFAGMESHWNEYLRDDCIKKFSNFMDDVLADDIVAELDHMNTDLDTLLASLVAGAVRKVIEQKVDESVELREQIENTARSLPID